MGHYSWNQNFPSFTLSNIALQPGTGITKVTVNGGRIGTDRMEMDFTMAEGEGNYNLKYNTDLGHVYGGGQGFVVDPNDDVLSPIVDMGEPDPEHRHRFVNFMNTVGGTEVTIGGTAWVKGAVYGGAENGHVRGNTSVTIEGNCQIGSGETAPGVPEEKYAENKFFNPLDYFTYGVEDVAASDALAECVHSPYDAATLRPYDPIAIKNDPTQTPTDGKTWFGNVFGGGSGYYPYITKVPGIG